MLHALLYQIKEMLFESLSLNCEEKKLAALGYFTLLRDFKLACMIKTYRSASWHQVLKIRERYIF